MTICSNERISRNLDVVDERIQALHLAVRPPHDAELPAPLLQHRDPDFELLHRLLDRHAEVAIQAANYLYHGMIVSEFPQKLLELFIIYILRPQYQFSTVM
jgi:hypothetical protein